MMDDELRPFLTWWVPWLAARSDNAPLGWYTREDLEAAFNGGMAAKDDRPGNPSLPPTGAGPVPAQD